MYVPASFAEDDRSKLHAFIRSHGFAILTSAREDGLFATHLPLLLEPDAGRLGRLVGHMARANPQWREVRGEVMAIFSGPHAYISPSWYEAPGTVPTWNYVAVHAYGTFRPVEGREPLLEILRASVREYEGSRPIPWTFDESAEALDGLLKSIVGFEIEITRLEGKWKLGQNHPDERRRKVVRALKGRSDDDSRAIAELMDEGLR